MHHKLSEKPKRVVHKSRRINAGVGGATIKQLFNNFDEGIIGRYPQAIPAVVQKDFVDDGGPYYSQFPEAFELPVKMKLDKKAKVTDVLSASLRYRCLLMNDRSLAVFDAFNLGNVKRYKSLVRAGTGTSLQYTFVFIGTYITEEEIDFRRTKASLVDMVGEPLSTIKIADGADYLKKSKLARAGELPKSERFSRIDLGDIVLKDSANIDSDIFTLGQFGSQIFVRNYLAEALIDAEISGIQICDPDKIKF